MSGPDPVTQRAARAAVDSLTLTHYGSDVRARRGEWLVTVWDAPPCRSCGGTGRDPERNPEPCRSCAGKSVERGPWTVATFTVAEDGATRAVAAVEDTREVVAA